MVSVTFFLRSFLLNKFEIDGGKAAVGLGIKNE